MGCLFRLNEKNSTLWNFLKTNQSYFVRRTTEDRFPPLRSTLPGNPIRGDPAPLPFPFRQWGHLFSALNFPQDQTKC